MCTNRSSLFRDAAREKKIGAQPGVPVRSPGTNSKGRSPINVRDAAQTNGTQSEYQNVAWLLGRKMVCDVTRKNGTYSSIQKRSTVYIRERIALVRLKKTLSLVRGYSMELLVRKRGEP